jgi:hypothetical protein
LGNCDVIINELCLRLAKTEPSFGQIKQLNIKTNQFMNEILYDTLRTSIQKQKKKKQQTFSITTSDSTLPQERLSSLRPRLFKPAIIPSSSSSSTSSRKRPFSALKNSSLFNQDLSFISYPPRRYLFAGAEIYFSSSDDDASDDELPRKHNE